MRTCLVGVMLIGWAVTPAVAQEDFSHVKAKAGQRLIVTEDGLSISGAVTEISPSKLVIEDHEVRPGPGCEFGAITAIRFRVA